MFGWDNTKQANVIENMLEEKALESFNGLSNDNKKNVNEIFKQLVSDCSKSADEYLKEFNERRLNKDESIESYASSIKRLLDKADPNMANEVK